MELRSFEAIVRALNDHRVQFLIVGGMAVVAHGHGRMTHDIDLVVRLDHENILRAFTAFSKFGYQPRVPVTVEDFADPATRRAWIAQKNMTVLNLYSDRFRTTPIDLFVQEPFDFEVAYANAFVADLEGTTVRFVDLATLIDMKIAAGRPIDLDDVSHLQLLQEENRGPGGSS